MVYYEEYGRTPVAGCIPHRTGSMQYPICGLPRSRILRIPASRAQVPLPSEQPLEAHLAGNIVQDSVHVRSIGGLSSSARHRTGAMRTSENPLKAKFAEFTFHALR